jgi:hypothetical protein
MAKKTEEITGKYSLGGYSLFSILAIIFAFVLFPLGIIFGIIALNEIKENPNLKGKGLAKFAIWWIPAIILGLIAISIILGIIAFIGGMISGFIR